MLITVLALVLVACGPTTEQSAQKTQTTQLKSIAGIDVPIQAGSVTFQFTDIVISHNPVDVGGQLITPDEGYTVFELYAFFTGDPSTLFGQGGSYYSSSKAFYITDGSAMDGSNSWQRFTADESKVSGVIQIAFILGPTAKPPYILHSVVGNWSVDLTSLPIRTPLPPAPTVTASITPTITETPTITTTPTKTPKPTTVQPKTYILEWGECAIGVTVDDLANYGDPANPGSYIGCMSWGRKQVTLSLGQSMTTSWPYGSENVENYCTLKNLDGTFVDGNLDTAGVGHATCSP